MKRIFMLLTTALLPLALMCAAPSAHAAAFVKYDGIDGEAMGPDGYDDWFVADSFSFGVEREMKESGEKGGTADINIGVGELQECTISKSMDSSSAPLAQAAANGRSLGACEVCLSDGETGGVPGCYAHFVMERCYVKSWHTSAGADERPTEEVAFYYNKIAFRYVENEPAEAMNWDRERHRPWPDGLTWLFDFSTR
jgi:type VI secretion system Hcp family effector